MTVDTLTPIAPITSITPANFGGRDVNSQSRQDLGLQTADTEGGLTPGAEGVEQGSFNQDGDSVNVSPEAERRANELFGNQGGQQPQATDASENSEENPEIESTDSSDDEEEVDAQGLTEEEQDLVRELKARDVEVRNHEQAHLAAAGDLAIGGASYDYQRGPDGKRYAVGGEVNIDVSKVPNDPEATVIKAERIKRAALAPAEPSGQDRRVASKADGLKAQAQREIREQAFDDSNGDELFASEESAGAVTTNTTETSQTEPPTNPFSSGESASRPGFLGEDDQQNTNVTFARRPQPFISATESQSTFSVIA